jgi:predicted nucleic acid-binding protein
MVSLIDTDVMIDLSRENAEAALTAATAIKQNCTLGSRNRKHFAMIENLRLEAPPY